MENNNLIPYITSIDEIEDNTVKKELQSFMSKDYVLGLMLWGSRATQFGEPDTDYDVLIYVDQKYFDSLQKKDIAILKFNEQVTPKKLLIDFTYWANSIFEDQLVSPMDIDHSAYVDHSAIVLYDKTGKLEEWRKKLAFYPLGTHKDRIKTKFIDLLVSFGYAQKNKVRNNELDTRLNLFKTLTIASNISFNLLKTWAPPLKWWSKHAKKLHMDDELFNLLSKSIQDLSVETTKKLIDALREKIKQDGVNLDNLTADFFETIYPEGRAKLIKFSYY